MNINRELYPLLDQLRRRFRQISARTLLIPTSRWSRRCEIDVAFGTIELHTMWSQFMRYYFLSSAIGARTSAGVRITHHLSTVRNAGDAINEAVYHMRPGIPRGRPWRPRDEPDWLRPHTAIELAKHFSFSHATRITAAFSHRTRVFEDLPSVRNFFAHRSRDTFRIAMRVKSFRGIKASSPSAAVISHAPNRPQPVLLDWMADLDIIGELLCTT